MSSMGRWVKATSHTAAERERKEVPCLFLEIMSAYYIPLEDIPQEDGLGVTSYHPDMTYSEADQSSTPRNAGKLSFSCSN